MYATRIIALAVVMATMVWGCAGSKKTQVTTEEDGRFRNFEKMDEAFDPATLNDDVTDQIIADEAETSAPDVQSTPIESSATQEDSVVTGFRVQLVQTTDPEIAKNVQTDAILKFDYDVYRVFDAPFYKVRVGDFINWYEAEKMQKLAVERGFKEAWVVRTKVNVNRAKKWLDNF